MLIFGPVVDFYLTSNPFDRSLRSASCVVSLSDLRLLSSIDFTVSGSYTMPSYQSLAREARRAEARLAELDYAASAVLEMLERQGVDQAADQLRAAILRSRAGAGCRIGWHVEDRERAPLSPTRTHESEKGLVSNGVL